MERGGSDAPPVEQGEGEQEEADQGWLSSGQHCHQISSVTIFLAVMSVDGLILGIKQESLTLL